MRRKIVKQEIKPMRGYMVAVEGIDKVGKEQVLKYLDILGKHKYVLMDRGLISNIAYSKIYGRDYIYDLDQMKDWTFVYLVCDKEDWEVRCKMTNEPKIDYDKHKKAFDEVVDNMIDKGFNVFIYNTTKYTPYYIATQLMNFLP